MSGLAATFLAAVAMVPAMVGTAEAGDRGLTLALCGGGTLSIAIPANHAPAPGVQPCCVAKGCETGKKRKRIDRAQ